MRVQHHTSDTLKPREDVDCRAFYPARQTGCQINSGFPNNPSPELYKRRAKDTMSMNVGLICRIGLHAAGLPSVEMSIRTQRRDHTSHTHTKFYTILLLINMRCLHWYGYFGSCLLNLCKFNATNATRQKQPLKLRSLKLQLRYETQDPKNSYVHRCNRISDNTIGFR